MKRTHLLILFLLALSPRIACALWGMPYTHHPDEHWIFEPAFRMTSSGDWDPGWYKYPPFLSILFRVLLTIMEPWFRISLALPSAPWMNPEAILPSQFPLLFAGRLLVVLFGAGTVPIVASIASRLAGPACGWLAGVLIVVCPLHIEHSAFLTTDVPATFFATLVLYSLVRWMDNFRHLWLILSGLAIGAAIGTKYNAGFLALAVPLAGLMSGMGFKRTAVATLSCGIWAVVAFLIFCPFIIWKPGPLLQDVIFEAAHYRRGHSGFEGAFNLPYYLHLLGTKSVLRWVGWGLLAAALPWIRLSAWRLRGFLLVAGAGLAYLMLLSFFRVRFDRNVLIVIPSAAICWGLIAAVNKPDLRPRFVVCAALILGFQTVPAIQLARASLAPTPHEQMMEWMATHVPAGSRVAREFQTPLLPPQRFRTRYLYAAGEFPLALYRAKQVDYILLSSSIHWMHGKSGGDSSFAQFCRWIWEQTPIYAVSAGDTGGRGEELRLLRVAELPDLPSFKSSALK